MTENEKKKISQAVYQEIEYICRLFAQTMKLPIYFLDEQQNIIFSFAYGHGDSPLHPDNQNLFSQLFQDTDSFHYPSIKSTPYYENYFAIRAEQNNQFWGTFVAGPSVYAAVTAEAIDVLIEKQKLPFIYKRQLIHYYSNVTIFDYSKLVSASLLLYYLFYHVKLDGNELIEKNSTPNQLPVKISRDFDESMSRNRQNVFFHHSPIGERNLFNCITAGDKEKLLICYQSPLDGEAGILSKNNPIRARKNLAICSVTLATRAAIEGGLDFELAYTLSDLYIQEIEETNEIKDISELDFRMLCDFTERVKKVKEHKYSKAVTRCQSFILKHLYEEITASELAQKVKLHPNYLSELFKKETGVTISEYIQKERVEEAKKLLSSSFYSLMDIANWLHFHDQSHFTRTFKKFTGTTPKKYRDDN